VRAICLTFHTKREVGPLDANVRKGALCRTVLFTLGRKVGEKKKLEIPGGERKGMTPT